jgi:two-component system sensor histidine kinase PilS (NtrC family)
MRWLMILRVVTVTTLLISAFVIELVLRPDETLRPLFLLSGGAFGMVAVYAVAHRWLSHSTLFLHLQLAGDALLITGFVAITGGVDSPMSFLYLLPIAVGSMLDLRRGGLTLAATCWTLYAGLVALPGVMPDPLARGLTVADSSRLLYTLVVHLVAFVAVAMLSSSLAERLRRQGNELIERSGTVARLQALNENIIESINSGLATTDPNGIVNFINRGGVEILGCRSGDVHGAHVEAMFGLGRGFLGEIRRQLSDHPRFRFEEWHDGPAGRMFLGIAASNLYDRTGQPLGLIFIFQDLTEIHALEQEVRLKERMAALGEMAAGMAHELRNPLAAISGSVQYLRGDLGASGETVELMDIILRESQRLDQAIRDFLTFARPGRFAPEPHDVVKLIRESLMLLTKSREFGPRHAVVTEFERDEDVACVDVNRMKQVFWNLSNNALKAMPDGGTVTIRVRASVPGQLEITFADEGRGMTDSEVENYFQPFQGSFGEGTGLGAAIVYRLVEEHGGRIRLHSAPGRGTRVNIVIPRHQPGIRDGIVADDRVVAGGAGR